MQRVTPSSKVVSTPSPGPSRNMGEAAPVSRLSSDAARRIMIALMFPSLLMPLASSMIRVALPIIRDEFGISADTTAWVAAAFTLPFMVLMPVYGRLSDGVGKRRLILAGTVIFTIGTAITVFSAGLAWLMAGRAIQGIGAAGMMPLGMAFISAIFSADERGKALGTWSSVGPTTAFVGPLLAGLLIIAWGWRAAFVPPLLMGIVAFFVVYKVIPAGLSNIRPHFWRTFDWAGVFLLAGALTASLFYLSSRPITGVEPLLDWRLLAMAVVLMGALVWWEKHRDDPFVSVGIFSSRTFSMASICASMRMLNMAGVGFLIPLYLVDIYHLNAAYTGIILMISPGSMALVVRFGGLAADRWGSRVPVVIGLSVLASVAALLSQLPQSAPLWQIGLILALGGLGSGLTLAALHRAAMSDVAESEMGSVAGMYSMIRFAGMVVGTALSGMLLQRFLDQEMPMIEAYHTTFLFFAGATLIGVVAGFALREP